MRSRFQWFRTLFSIFRWVALAASFVLRKADTTTFESIDIPNFLEQPFDVEVFGNTRDLRRNGTSPVERTLSASRRRVEGSHHAHVFMFDRVAMKRVRARERRESVEDFDFVSVVIENDHVLFEAVAAEERGPTSIDTLRLRTGQVHVDGMPPAAGFADEDPTLRAS